MANKRLYQDLEDYDKGLNKRIIVTFSLSKKINLKLERISKKKQCPKSRLIEMLVENVRE